MTPADIDRVFGRGRVRMVTGEHVEVFREASLPGERRRYTKRFLATAAGDFREWTEREWRILARLVGHGVRAVPQVVQFDRGAAGRAALVQTYDAGITVDQWATLLPVSRDGVVRRSVFDDCAHWWALAHHCLAALNEIHALQLVHLDIKGDNLCIPYGPPHFDAEARDTALYAVFARLALIDFAFSLVSGERLGTPLPIGWQKDYDYQSPRLLAALEAGRNGDLRPTQELDWRCDLYSLAAMLKRYLPDADEAHDDANGDAWTASRYDDARALIYRLRDCHDRELQLVRPHQELMDYTGARVRERDLAESLTRGWTLARDALVTPARMPLTPLTRVVAPSQVGEAGREVPRIVLPTAATAVIRRPRARVATRTTAVIRRPRARLPDSPALVHAVLASAPLQENPAPFAHAVPAAAPPRRHWRAAGLASVIGAAAALAAPSFIGDPDHPLAERLQQSVAVLSRPGSAGVRTPPQAASAQATSDSTTQTRPPPATSDSTTPGTSTPATTNETPSISPRNDLAETKPRRPAAAPAPPTHAPAMAKANRVPASRFALHGSTPPVVVASGTKPVHPGAAAPRTEIASASHSIDATRIPTETATASRPAPVSQTHIEGAADQVSASALSAPSNLPNAPPAPAVHDEPAPKHAGASANSEMRMQSTPAPAPRERPSAKTRRTDPLGEFLKMFAWHQRAAPVEDRSVGSSKPVEKAVRPPRAPESIQLADATGSARTPSQSATVAASPAPRVGVSPPSHVAAPPARVAPPASQVITSPMAPATFPAAKSAIAPTPEQRIDAAAPAANSAASEADAATPATSDVVQTDPRTNVDAHPGDSDEDALASNGRQLVTDVVPGIAASAYGDLSPALAMVSLQADARQDRAIVNALRASWHGEARFVPTTTLAPPRARRLHEEAWNGYAHGRPVADVLRLELAAFAANPRDPDIAGFLAFLHLHANPANPETARQLALHAITMSGAQRTRRVDDWSTLAIASALAGRHRDATRLFLVELALAVNIDRSCRAALNAYSDYGEPLRVPVQTMLARVKSDPRAYEYPSCTDRSASVAALRRTPS